MKNDEPDATHYFITVIICLAALVAAVQVGMWHQRNITKVENCDYFTIRKGAK